jgi:cytochrome c553
VAALAVSFPLNVLAQGAPTGSADAGKAKNSMCVGCHGIPDYHTAYPVVYHVPEIAGQSPQYIINALREYKSGDRNHPSMRGIAGQLTDQDMADLAAYYGRPQGGAK